MLIDCGSGLETDRIVANIKNDGFDPKRINKLFVTHAHTDHAGGSKAMQDEIGCEIVAPEIEDRLMREGTDQELGLDVTKAGGFYPKDYVYSHFKPDRLLKHGDKFGLGKYELRCIQVPGHNLGPMAILLSHNGRRGLFSNDIVFVGGTIGLGNWQGSSLSAYRENIGKLSGLRVEELFPGHFLWTLRGGQEHLDKAINNLGRPFPPPNFGHAYPHF